jgi:hypothetical protein
MLHPHQQITHSHGFIIQQGSSKPSCYDDMQTSFLNLLHLRAQTFVLDCSPHFGPCPLQAGNLLVTGVWLS